MSFSHGAAGTVDAVGADVVLVVTAQLDAIAPDVGAACYTFGGGLG
jgi:hypothetical protein